jgi:hypothetical protein
MHIERPLKFKLPPRRSHDPQFCRKQLQFLFQAFIADCMRNLLHIFLPLVIFAASLSGQSSLPAPAGTTTTPQSQTQSKSAKAAPIPIEQENAHKARALIEQGIQALGGQAWLNLHNKEEQGRAYSFYHGRPTSNGVVYWRFIQYPDKERVELTQQRDVAEIYVGNKGTEVTYKGPREIEKKDMDDYLRRRRFSLENILHNWVNDPTVALFFDGPALAGSQAAQKVTLINNKDEAVDLYFDIDTNLPIMKSYTWRDSTDHEKNTEEETWNGYRSVQGIMTPWGFTRYYNGDMQTERFINSASYDQELNPTMFDPNSGYNALKEAEKAEKAEKKKKK